ncbi:hypothetical protein L210DRAFT_3555741 [Boletus edulis BED1]|uniref:Uncharacterized protein n=1 Tax=Boletus edulis BED1 TaxID=1328754 RepID=A0AAD4GBE2_BOLED|nr:hypothetical protein L210DRAFT_3555741 [Boletus edulis BED1]
MTCLGRTTSFIPVIQRPIRQCPRTPGCPLAKSPLMAPSLISMAPMATSISKVAGGSKRGNFKDRGDRRIERLYPCTLQAFRRWRVATAPW